jgi:hypothetical protein
MSPCSGASPVPPPSDLPPDDTVVPLGTQAGVARRGGVVVPPLPPLPPSRRRRLQARVSALRAPLFLRLTEVLWLLVMPLSPSSLLPLAWCPWLCNLILLLLGAI